MACRVPPLALRRLSERTTTKFTGELPAGRHDDREQSAHWRWFAEEAKSLASGPHALLIDLSRPSLDAPIGDEDELMSEVFDVQKRQARCRMGDGSPWQRRFSTGLAPMRSAVTDRAGLWDRVKPMLERNVFELRTSCPPARLTTRGHAGAPLRFVGRGGGAFTDRERAMVTRWGARSPLTGPGPADWKPLSSPRSSRRVPGRELAC